jgi:5-methylcytosine-specific restriction endonuclease McrA
MAHSRQYALIMSSSRWQKLQAETLKARPYCERCKEMGWLTPSKVVHHKQPIESGHSNAEYERLAFDTQNLQALCHQCHADIHRKVLGSYSRAGRLQRQNDRLQRWISTIKERITNDS